MRVVRTRGSDADDWVPSLCTHRGQPYAILSHRWLQDANHEVVFADIEVIDEVMSETSSDSPAVAVKNAFYAGANPRIKLGFPKLQGAAHQALKDGYEYIWVDTCCIDKSSSAELSEAINSMWMWYKASNICYVYLIDVPNVTEADKLSLFKTSQWWTRGWTLQELLAPRELKFFTSDWTVIGEKRHMDLTISDIAGIDRHVINGSLSPQAICIAQRMSWVSQRTTTRVEDLAYCLMGLFAVNMPLLYGEGAKAFLRLQQEIMKDSDDETIFAWRDGSIDPNIYSGLLAARPFAFASCRKLIKSPTTDARAPHVMTNKGLSITLPLSPTYDSAGRYIAHLHCPNPETGSRHVGIYLKRISYNAEQYARVNCDAWAVKHRKDIIPRQEAIYVKQTHDQRPAYERIGPDRIRLLRAITTSTNRKEYNGTIKVTLFEADINTSSYVALSYVESGLQLSTLWIDGQSMDVDDNVANFLKFAHFEGMDDLFWIDVICRPRYFGATKIDQMRLRRKAYAHATRVVVWLADTVSDDRSLQALTQRSLITQPCELIEITGRELNLRSASKDDQSCTAAQDPLSIALTVLKHIAADPYWKTLWKVQEFLVANDISVHISARDNGSCYSRGFSVETLVNWYRAALSKIGHADLLTEQPLSDMGRFLQFSEMKDHVDCIGMTSIQRPNSEFKTDKFPFENLLESFRFAACRNPTDRIHGLIDISDLAGKFHVDDEKSPIAICSDIIKCLGENLTLSITTHLLQALEIRLDGDQLPQISDPGANFTCEFEQTAYPIASHTIENNSSDSNLPTDALIIDDLTRFPTEHTEAYRGGLLFTRIGTNPKTSHKPQETLYKPSGLYIRKSPTHYSLANLPPVFGTALMHTHAKLQERTDSSLSLRIQTDQTGILALGFCAQWTNRDMPPVFDLIKDQIYPETETKTPTPLDRQGGRAAAGPFRRLRARISGAKS